MVWNNINIPRVADDQHIANITLVSSNTTNFDTSNNIETATEQLDVPIPCNNSDDRIVEEDPGISIEADNPDENDEVVLATQFPQLKQQNAKKTNKSRQSNVNCNVDAPIEKKVKLEKEDESINPVSV